MKRDIRISSIGGTPSRTPRGATFTPWLPLVQHMKSAMATANRVFKENIRAYPWSSFAVGTLSSFFTVALAYLLYSVMFGHKTAASFQSYTGTTDYLTFVVVGVAIQVYSNNALLSVGRSLITERRMGTLESLFLSPTSHSAYLLGVLLQQAALTSVDVVVMILISIPFGANFTRVNWVELVIVLIIGHIGFLGMGVILGAVMLYLRDTYLTQNTVLVLLYLVCGVLFPIQYLPAWVQSVAHFIPLTFALMLARSSALFNRGPAQQLWDLFTLFVLSCAYCAVGLFLMHKVRRIALEDTLS